MTENVWDKRYLLMLTFLVHGYFIGATTKRLPVKVSARRRSVPDVGPSSWITTKLDWQLLIDNGKNNIKITFALAPSKYNFDEYELHLFTNDNLSQGKKLYRIDTKKNSNKTEGEVTFENVTPGDFYVRLTPVNKNRHDPCKCLCRRKYSSCGGCIQFCEDTVSKTITVQEITTLPDYNSFTVAPLLDNTESFAPLITGKAVAAGSIIAAIILACLLFCVILRKRYPSCATNTRETHTVPSPEQKSVHGIQRRGSILSYLSSITGFHIHEGSATFLGYGSNITPENSYRPDGGMASLLGDELSATSIYCA